MKKRLLILLAAVMLMAAAGQAYAAGGYTYTVRILAGRQGTFAGGATEIVYDNLSYGDRVNFSAGSVTLPDGSKYYVRGIKETGKDNDTAMSSFKVTKDIDYIVAYGVKGNMVGYTVNYVDGSGRTLAPSENYVGNIGDRPVIAFLYVDGYKPQAYNLTGTLTENAEDNVFTFEYTPVDPLTVSATAPAASDGSNGGNTSQGSNSGSTAQGSAGGNSSQTGSGSTSGEPAEILDIHEGEIPVQPAEDTPAGTDDTAAALPAAAQIGIAALAGMLVVGLIVFLVIRFRSKEN